MRKGYFGVAGSQIHYREAGDSTQETLVLLPPSPSTGSYYTRLIEQLSIDCHIIAIDYPGFGGSDRIETVSIAAYANALEGIIKAHGRVSLLGFHTGTLVAQEIALKFPEMVRHIIMIDVPYFDPETREKYNSGLSAEGIPTSVEESFSKVVTHRDASFTEDRAFEIWVENMRSGRYKNDAFRAAFAYDCDTQFAKLKHPLTVIATTSSLLEPSRKTAKSIPHSDLIEILEITAPVFEAHSEKLVPVILEALSE